MLAGSTLVLLLAAATDPASAAPPAARAELDACAERIEEMKARRERGTELDRLLRRAQELAAELERASGSLPVHPGGPSPEELREQADAARDEADRLAAEIAAIDVRLQDARRSRGEPASGLQRAAMGTPAPAASEAPLRALQAKRTALAERRARAEAEANRFEAEAGAAER